MGVDEADAPPWVPCRAPGLERARGRRSARGGFFSCPCPVACTLLLPLAPPPLLLVLVRASCRATSSPLSVVRLPRRLLLPALAAGGRLRAVGGGARGAVRLLFRPLKRALQGRPCVDRGWMCAPRRVCVGGERAALCGSDGRCVCVCVGGLGERGGGGGGSTRGGGRVRDGSPSPPPPSPRAISALEKQNTPVRCLSAARHHPPRPRRPVHVGRRRQDRGRLLRSQGRAPLLPPPAPAVGALSAAAAAGAADTFDLYPRRPLRLVELNFLRMHMVALRALLPRRTRLCSVTPASAGRLSRRPPRMRMRPATMPRPR